MSQETERYQLENNGNTYLARASASGGGADVEANPTGTATTDLTKLKVDDTIYGIPEGTNVVANPTLAGTESALTGLQVGDTKYAVESGMTNPMTAVGDMIYGGSNGTPTRLPRPSTTKYLRNTSGGSLSWEDIAPENLHRVAGLLGQCIYANNNSSGNGFALGKPASDFGLGILTTAPSSANTDGIKIVVLTSEPATRYNGYLYIITA